MSPVIKNRKLIWNSLYNVLAFAIPVLVLFFLTPFFIARIGEDGYGIWILAMSILGLAGALELGLGVATTKYVAEYSALDDNQGLSTIFTATFLIYGFLGLIVGIILYLFAPIVPTLFKISPELSYSAVTSVRIIAVAVWPSLAIGAFAGIPRGLQKYAVPSLLNIILSIGAPLGALVIVGPLNGSIVQIMVWIATLNWLVFIAIVLIAWIMLKDFRIKLRIYKEYLKSYFAFSFFSAISNIGGKIFTSGDRVLVGVLLGPAAVTYYTISIGVANKSFYLAGMLTQAVMPRVSELAALKKDDDVRRLFHTATRIISLISLGLGAALFGLSEPFLQLWLGNDFTAHTLGAFRWMIVIYAILGMTPVAYFVSNGVGFPKVAAAGAFIGGALTLALMPVLTKYYSLDGAAIANSGYLMSFVPVIFLLKREKTPLLSGVKNLFAQPLLVFIAFTGISLMIPGKDLLMVILIGITGILFLFLGIKDFRGILAKR